MRSSHGSMLRMLQNQPLKSMSFIGKALLLYETQIAAHKTLGYSDHQAEDRAVDRHQAARDMALTKMDNSTRAKKLRSLTGVDGKDERAIA